MPEGGVAHLAHGEILSYEEIYTIVEAAAGLGISKVRITGGEPLVRLNLPEMVRMLARIKSIDDLSLTTNGVLLALYAAELKAAGLGRVNISLDTLKPERFGDITRCGSLDDTLNGIEASQEAGLSPIKINMVVMAGINDDELTDFAAKTVADGWHVRFIEIMPFTEKGAPDSRFISVNEMKKRLQTMGEMVPVSGGVGNGPARYFRLSGAAGTIGFITPVSEHFCFQCNRLRLTADGKLRPCLLSAEEIDLKQPLRQDMAAEKLKSLIQQAVAAKPYRHNLAEGCVPQDRSISQVGG